MTNNFTVIVPFRDGHATLERLLNSLPQTQPVLIVDDLSAQPYQTRRANVRVLRLKQRGYFAGAVNVGMNAIDGDALVLNQDVWLEGDGWLKFIQEHAGAAIAGDGVMEHPAHPNGYVQGTFMYLSRAAWQAVGEFNARDFPLWGCTAEWQLRACRLGFTAAPGRVTGLRHERRQQFGGAITRALEDEPGKRSLFIRTPPLISVIVPCYNYGRYLPDAIASLIGGPSVLGRLPAQTFAAFEVLIVDDASEDDSVEIARGLVNPWTGVHLVALPENKGTPGAINAGVRAAHGRYVTVFSADDLMLPDRLERLYRAAEQNQHNVICDDLRVLTKGQLGERWGLPPYDPLTIAQKNSMHAGIFYPRAWWEELGGYPENMVYGREDWAFNVGLSRAGHHGLLIDYAGYVYRRHESNRSNRNKGEEWRARFMEQLNALYPDIYGGKTMCCGQRNIAPSPKVKAAAVKPAKQLPGAEGMVLLEYIGANTGQVSWFGPSGTRYETSGSKRKIYVDTKDADFFLAVIEARKKVFRLIPPSPSGGVSPELAAKVNPPAVATPADTATITLSDGVSDTEAHVAARALAKRPRRSRKKETPADAVATA